MPACEEVFALLSQYRELPEAMCVEMDAHISSCAPCVEFVESLKKTIDLCREYEAEARPGPLPEASQKELFGAYQRMIAARGR
jgi:hypothetical protein